MLLKFTLIQYVTYIYTYGSTGHSAIFFSYYLKDGHQTHLTKNKKEKKNSETRYDAMSRSEEFLSA